MNASSRAERGQGERGEKMGVRKARQREGSAWTDRAAAAEVLNALTGGKPDGPRPWESALSKRLAGERQAYEDLSASMKEMIPYASAEERALLEKNAALVSRQAMSLRQIITRRSAMTEIAKREDMASAPDRVAAAEQLARRYRDERQVREAIKAPAAQANIARQLETGEQS